MSTPRVLLGRSLTCPSEASTLKPLPRYFWIVFALAGDSTMTKPLDNVSSVSGVFELTLARIGGMGQVTARKLSAISSQPSAFSRTMKASSSPRRLLAKGPDNQLHSTFPNRVQGERDIPAHLRSLSRF